MMQVVGALSQKAERNALVEFKTMDDRIFLMKNLEWFCFGLVVISLMFIVFYMMVNTSESESEENPESRRRRYLFSSLDEVVDPDEWMALNHHNYSSSSQDSEPEVENDAAGPRVDTPLQFGMYHVYLFMQGCFQRLRHLMATDHSMQGRGYAILHNLLRILRNYERHGITSGEADHMTVMHRSINEMESVLLSRGGSVLAIQDEGQGRMYQDSADNLVLEPDVEEPSAEEIAEKGIRVAIPDADQPGSPEHGKVDGPQAYTQDCYELCGEKACYVQVHGHA